MFTYDNYYIDTCVSDQIYKVSMNVTEMKTEF